jgi:hypothetical protein
MKFLLTLLLFTILVTAVFAAVPLGADPAPQDTISECNIDDGTSDAISTMELQVEVNPYTVDMEEVSLCDVEIVHDAFDAIVKPQYVNAKFLQSAQKYNGSKQVRFVNGGQFATAPQSSMPLLWFTTSAEYGII